ncbi:MAG: adenine phosphoribosyltransferase [Candidatus Marinimicrobia bacterium]|jgi:adenine phosphoribosyltransferase|nr:adenine phosphoribosyltransferase [Candidatus Neomarinimicrobiota bacterium]MDP6612373.1 adenine phosphoribosyltransferase [Candidatus Neomarinimicrobiota bacterium]|tara:strand:+ start:6210 stop:6731 length:522 start_codon:yes stop_codon:yes gene_type:complete
MNIERIKKSIRNVPDFPKPGIQFKDITTLLQNPDAFGETIDFFYNTFKNENIDVIVGIESRGFIFAAPLSLKLGCKFALVRKPGKLPYNTISEEYELEYGTDAIEMHKDAIIDGDRVLIVDDLLATGGTANATGSLVKRLNGKIISYAFVIELVELNGAGLLDPNSIYSIVKY